MCICIRKTCKQNGHPYILIQMNHLKMPVLKYTGFVKSYILTLSDALSGILMQCSQQRHLKMQFCVSFSFSVIVHT